MPKFRIVKHEQGSKVWYLIEKRKWLFWNRVAYTTSAEEANLKLADLLAASTVQQREHEPIDARSLRKSDRPADEVQR